MKLTNAQEQEAFRSVKRACYGGLDSVALRTEVARRAARVVPFEAHSFATTDPDTGLITHVVGEGLSAGLIQEYVQRLYPYESAAATIDGARKGEVVFSVSTRVSGGFGEVLQAAGLRHEVNAALCTDGALWGSWCMLRESGSRAFDERERRFLRRVAPHLARGLRSAALIDTAVREEPDRETPPPGMLVLDGQGRIGLRNGAVAAYLEDLADVGTDPELLPFAVASVVGRVQRAGTPGEDAPLDAVLRVRARSGRWYTLRASRAEPDAAGESSVLVLVEPVGSREIAPILTRLYGLSAREREVIALVARGESTKRVAARLGLSSYTVQEHLDRACGKVGVRGRKALLARIFFDGYAPRLGG